MAYNNNYKKKKYPERRDPDVPLTEKEIKDLTSKAKDLCFYYLMKTDKTRQELKNRLYQKFIPAEIIESVLDDLEQRGYINDAKLAASFVHSKTSYGNLGKRAIESKLQARGVSRDLISDATDSIDMEEEFDKAKKLAVSRLRSTKKLDKQKRYQTLLNYLLRRGYGGDNAYRAVREALDEEDIDDEDF
jgi:regulatory protein